MDDERTALQVLADQFGAELIGLNEFAELVDLGPSTAAQLRTERKRDLTGFPPVVSESGRSFLHRLGDLVDWIERSRFSQLVTLDDQRASAWRIERRMRVVIEQVGVYDARRLLAALAIIAMESLPTGRSVRQIARANANDQLIGDLLDGVPPIADSLIASVVAELISPECSPSTIDDVLVDLGNHQPGTPTRTPTSLACLVALALAAEHGDDVHEPTSGECETLIRVIELARHRGQTLGDVSGSDRDGHASRIGKARLRLANVDARIGDVPIPGTVDRLVIDPGAATDRRQLASWTRLLHRDGRAVVLTRLNQAVSDLIAELPPIAILIPPQRQLGPTSTVAVWISEPFCEIAADCVIVDLRAGSLPSEPMSSERQRLPHALKELGGVRWNDRPDEWTDFLGDLIDEQPRVLTVPAVDLEHQLERLTRRALDFTPEVVDENRNYALSLARELERLIGGRDTGGSRNDQPDESPSGVLAGRTTHESRRVIARLVDALAGDRPRVKRTPTPAAE